MENLHTKYVKEFPLPPVSLSVFKRARPEHVLLLKDTSLFVGLLMAAVPTVQKFSVNEWPVTTSEEEAHAAMEEHLEDILVVKFE